MKRKTELSFTITDITNSLKFERMDFRIVYGFLDIRSDEEYILEMQIETLFIKITDDDLFNSYTSSDTSTRIIKTIKDEPLGYNLKELELDDIPLTKNKLFKILTKTRKLETLVLNLKQEVFIPVGGGRGKWGKGGGILTSLLDDSIDEKEEAFDDNFIYVPILEDLKTLLIHQGLNSNMFLFELLPLCPNLEALFITCHENVGNELLEVISKFCPKLKTLSIKSDNSLGQFELDITDEGLGKFLEKQSNIEEIDVQSVSFISGAILKRLGDFPKLKSFTAQRMWYEGEYSRQEDIYFGGKPNPNLEFVDIGPSYEFTDEQFEKLINSLQTLAPNLKDWGDLGEENTDPPRNIVKHFVNSVEAIDVNSNNIATLPSCKNLKTVFWMSEIEIPDNRNSNPNVSELIILQDGKETYSKMSLLFPNVNILNASGCDSIEYLIENITSWPQLVHVIVSFTPDSATLETLSSQRPNLFIEFKLCELSDMPISPQVFYYQWLVRDEK